MLSVPFRWRLYLEIGQWFIVSNRTNVGVISPELISDNIDNLALLTLRELMISVCAKKWHGS